MIGAIVGAAGMGALALAVLAAVAWTIRDDRRTRTAAAVAFAIERADDARHDAILRSYGVRPGQPRRYWQRDLRAARIARGEDPTAAIPGW